MESSKRCRKCDTTIERDRPKWAKYCKKCGRHRSRDWKREHPDRAKLHGSEQASRYWRERNNWNAYIKSWREAHHAEYRAQNKRHLHEHRNRNRRTRTAALNARSILIVACLLLLVLVAQGCESLPQLKVSVETLDHFDGFLVRFTATFALTAACLRLVLHDVVALISEARRRRMESDRNRLTRRRI